MFIANRHTDRWQGGILALLLLTVVFHGCRKDPADPPGPNGTGLTPYFLQLPWSIADSLPPPLITSDNPLTVQGVELGRKLFFEKALSDDFSMSCASCHLQENAFSDPLPFSIGTDGSVGTRNAMAIVNMAWDQHFFWDGRTHTLEEQALFPVIDQLEMRNTWPTVVERLSTHPDYPALFEQVFGSPEIDSTRVVKAIAQFERTLVSFNSPFDRFYYGGDTLALTEAEQRGMDLFFREGRCVDCHRPPLFTDHAMRNNGLDMEPTDPGLGGITGQAWDMGSFKVTTLRNISVTAPYMHDSRFATLEEVVDFYADDVQVDHPHLDNHMFPWVQGLVQLNAEQRADLVAFMHALTDEQFLTDPRFSDPH